MQKGHNQRYLSLSARDVKPVQIARLKQRFELAEESVLAETVAVLTRQMIEDDEEKKNTRRVHPGELVIERDSQRLCLPLLPPRWTSKLQEGVSALAIRHHAEMEQYKALEAFNQEATIEDVWKITNQAALVKKRAKGDFDYLPEKPLDIDTLNIQHMPNAGEAISKATLNKAVNVLVDQYGCRPSQAESMVSVAAEA